VTGEDTSEQPAVDRTAPLDRLAPVTRAVRVLATAAVLALTGTYVAAQVDFLRRHDPSIPPARYWLPQLRTIWAPGLALALVCAAAAFVLHRWWARRK
jgi:hypothetical protein